MKDRYFGDIHDYIKYALLRQLTDPDTSTAVCWMLTEDDGGKDGRHTDYLKEPEVWSSFDPNIFALLRHQVLERKNRRVRVIEKSDILPNCRFYSDILTDDYVQRRRYFDQFSSFARGASFVFFDPDNGVEVKSVKYGRRNSSKYLYWSEIELALRANRSVMIYQHLPPQPRTPLIGRATRRLLRLGKGGVVYTIRTGKVAFFLVPRRGSVPQFRKRVSAVEKTWGAVLRVSERRRD